MNQSQRKTLADIMAKLEGLRCAVEDMKSEEEDKLDNMPESLRYSDKGDKGDEVVGNLDSAMDNLQSAIDDLDAACS